MGGLSCGCGSIKEISDSKEHEKIDSNNFSQQKSTDCSGGIIKRIYWC